MKLILASAILLAMPFFCAAERIVLVAGGGADTNTTVPIKATAAKLDSPFGVDFDAAGNLSAPSAGASATTPSPDMAPPSVPSNLPCSNRVESFL